MDSAKLIIALFLASGMVIADEAIHTPKKTRFVDDSHAPTAETIPKEMARALKALALEPKKCNESDFTLEELKTHLEEIKNFLAIPTGRPEIPLNHHNLSFSTLFGDYTTSYKTVKETYDDPLTGDNQIEPAAAFVFYDPEKCKDPALDLVIEDLNKKRIPHATGTDMQSLVQFAKSHPKVRLVIYGHGTADGLEISPGLTLTSNKQELLKHFEEISNPILLYACNIGLHPVETHATSLGTPEKRAEWESGLKGNILGRLHLMSGWEHERDAPRQRNPYSLSFEIARRTHKPVGSFSGPVYAIAVPNNTLLNWVTPNSNANPDQPPQVENPNLLGLEPLAKFIEGIEKAVLEFLYSDHSTENSDGFKLTLKSERGKLPTLNEAGLKLSPETLRILNSLTEDTAAAINRDIELRLNVNDLSDLRKHLPRDLSKLAQFRNNLKQEALVLAEYLLRENGPPKPVTLEIKLNPIKEKSKLPEELASSLPGIDLSLYSENSMAPFFTTVRDKLSKEEFPELSQQTCYFGYLWSSGKNDRKLGATPEYPGLYHIYPFKNPDFDFQSTARKLFKQIAKEITK